jgi:hypothetical protein
MNLKELILGPDGKISHTKFWSNIAYATGTGVFILQAYKGTLTPDVWLIYMGVVGAHSAVSKMISSKYGGVSTSVSDTKDDSGN